jgi:hypothetical protein
LSYRELLSSISRTAQRSSPGLDWVVGHYNWLAYEFWCFAFVQKQVVTAAQTCLEFPPMQKGASFNLQRLKEELAKKMASHAAQ